MITSLVRSSIFLLSSVLSPVDSPQAVPLAVNTEQVHYQALDQKSSLFLSRMAVSRLVNIREGNVAVQRGSAQAIRDYARKVVKDNYAMTASIRRLADAHSANLPGGVTSNDRQLLVELERWPESDFDLRFSNLMIANLERDIIEFRKAVLLKDLDVSNFALNYISVLQSNFAEIKAIKARLKHSH